MQAKVEKALEKIRPMLQADGGDIKLVSVDEKTGVVTVALQGACSCCPSGMLTLKLVVERQLKAEVPEVKELKQAAC